MKYYRNETLAFIFTIGMLIGMLIILIISLITGNTYNDGYETGQIDAINGKIEYQLVVNPDKTSQWEKIEKR